MSEPTQPLLKANAMAKDYRDADRTLHVLKSIDLTLKHGEAVAIIGASGAGKSTLLHLLGGLDRPSGGSISVNGIDLSTLSDRALARFRNRTIGFIFQFHHLLAEFTALENVMMPGLIAGEVADSLEKRSLDFLEQVGLSDRLTHRPAKLSGGEQQRVALARALINSPSLILADEPTGNLDKTTGTSVIDLLWKKTKGENKTLLIVTHDPDIAARADRVLTLTEGTLRD